MQQDVNVDEAKLKDLDLDENSFKKTDNDEMEFTQPIGILLQANDDEMEMTIPVASLLQAIEDDSTQEAVNVEQDEMEMTVPVASLLQAVSTSTPIQHNETLISDEQDDMEMTTPLASLFQSAEQADGIVQEELVGNDQIMEMTLPVGAIINNAELDIQKKFKESENNLDNEVAETVDELIDYAEASVFLDEALHPECDSANSPNLIQTPLKEEHIFQEEIDGSPCLDVSMAQTPCSYKSFDSRRSTPFRSFPRESIAIFAEESCSEDEGDAMNDETVFDSQTPYKTTSEEQRAPLPAATPFKSTPFKQAAFATPLHATSTGTPQFTEKVQFLQEITAPVNFADSPAMKVQHVSKRISFKLAESFETSKQSIFKSATPRKSFMSTPKNTGARKSMFESVATPSEAQYDFDAYISMNDKVMAEVASNKISPASSLGGDTDSKFKDMNMACRIQFMDHLAADKRRDTILPRESIVLNEKNSLIVYGAGVPELEIYEFVKRFHSH